MSNYKEHGVGIDDFGNEWKYFFTDNGKYGLHYKFIIRLKGPKGKTLEISRFFLINGNGEIVHDEWDPICE